jgi:endonuclease-3
MTMKDKIIIDALNIYYPDPKIELYFNKDYELVLAVMLSAQTTDKRVNMVTEHLFKEYDSLEKLDKLSLEEVENKIKIIGMYRNKAKNFKGIVSSLLKIGNVPNNRELLENLPGVGRKTTNVVLSILYNEPCIAVDTHVNRVSKRLAIANEEDDVLEIENKLMKFFPKNIWSKVHYQIVLFGRYRCKAIKPMCEDCKMQNVCEYYKNKKDN